MLLKEYYKDCKNILLNALCVLIVLFYKKVVVLHRGNNNLHDEEMITS